MATTRGGGGDGEEDGDGDGDGWRRGRWRRCRGGRLATMMADDGDDEGDRDGDDDDDDGADDCDGADDDDDDDDDSFFSRGGERRGRRCQRQRMRSSGRCGSLSARKCSSQESKRCCATARGMPPTRLRDRQGQVTSFQTGAAGASSDLCFCRYRGGPCGRGSAGPCTPCRCRTQCTSSALRDSTSAREGQVFLL